MDKQLSIAVTQKKEELLLRIARHLIIHASFMKEAGLYHGKMGVVLFFAHYGRYTGDSLYEDFASELLTDLLKMLHREMPVNLESGLCGIGWGIEYLLQHGFMEGDSDEILADMDAKIMERNLTRITDMSLPTGLEGVGCYIHTRIHSSARNQDTPPFDTQYLMDWEAVKPPHILDDYLLLASIRKDFPQDDCIAGWKMGLENGCAGYGLKLMLG